MAIRARIVDITALVVDAIVNAANESLAPGGGVCGAIHRAAGPQLALACAAVGSCATGDARLTPGFQLPAKFVIHAVGPAWRGGHAHEAELLASAYRSSMRIARDEEMVSVAFPAISTGIFGSPLGEATQIAVGTIRDELRHGGSVSDVTFACFSAQALDAYVQEGVATS